MKFKYIVVYEKCLDKFNIGHYQIKVKVTGGVQTVFPFTSIQIMSSNNSTGESFKAYIKQLCSTDINI